MFIVPNAVIGDRRGNGIQLEQPAAVRADDEQRATVARAVAAFYPELVWGCTRLRAEVPDGLSPPGTAPGDARGP